MEATKELDLERSQKVRCRPVTERHFEDIIVTIKNVPFLSKITIILITY